jgi:hypothetical protein
MTVAALSALITGRLRERAEHEPNPERYLAVALVRLLAMETIDELIAFGGEYGILYSPPDWIKEGGLV